MPPPVHTQAPVTQEDLGRTEISEANVETDVEGVYERRLYCVQTYQVRSVDGVILWGNKSLAIPLSPSDEAHLQSFWNATVLPALNAAEGT